MSRLANYVTDQQRLSASQWLQVHLGTTLLPIATPERPATGIVCIDSPTRQLWDQPAAPMFATVWCRVPHTPITITLPLLPLSHGIVCIGSPGKQLCDQPAQPVGQCLLLMPVHQSLVKLPVNQCHYPIKQVKWPADSQFKSTWCPGPDNLYVSGYH